MQIFGIELLGSQLILSVFILFVIFYPGFLSKIANLLNIGRGVDFALYVSIILLFYLVYKINIKIGKINRDLTKIVRNMAIKNKKL